MQKILTGGYYLVSLDKIDLKSDTISLPNVAKLLYDALKYKFVVFTEIVIDGVERNAIPCEFSASLTYTQQPEDWNEEEDGEFVPDPIYTAKIVNLYGLDLDIDANGGVTVTEHSGGGLDPDSIPEGDILQNTVLGLDEAGKVVKGNLFGKYARVLLAPTSTNLTEDEVSIIINGCFVEGDFLGFKNPCFYPAQDIGSIYRGCLIGSKGSEQFQIAPYSIFKYDRKIDVDGGDEKFIINYNSVELDARNFKIKGKFLPNNPATQTDKKFYFVINNGTLEWQEGNGLYLHTVTFSVSGTTGTMELRFISDSPNPFILDGDSNNFVNPDATFINLANQSNVVITPYKAIGFNPDIHTFNATAGTFSNAMTFSGILTQTVTPIK